MLICHTADWHLSPQGSQLDPKTGLNQRLIDRYNCALFTVHDAVERGAELILHAGDVGNHWHWTPTIARLAKQAFAPALERGIPVIVLEGNHDQIRNPQEYDALDLLRDIPGLFVIDRPCLLDVYRGRERLLISNRNESEFRPSPEDAVCEVACLPYPQANLLLRDAEARKLDPGDRNLLIREKMMDVARGLASDRSSDRSPDIPRILMGHFAVDIAEAGARNSLAMLTNEFTLNVNELAGLGFDGILLGHYHRPQGWQFDNCMVGYCGSPEACAFGEEGEEKQYLLWDIDKDGATAAAIPTPYRRLLTLALSDFTEEGNLLDTIGDQLVGAIVRLEIPPDSTLTIDEAKRAIEAAGAFEARVTKARAESVRRREHELTAGMALSEAVREWLAQKPDLHPLAEAIVAVALEVEAAMQGGVA